MSNTSSAKILVSADALYSVLDAMLKNGVEMRELVATVNLPPLSSTHEYVSPLKQLKDEWAEFNKKTTYHEPMNVFFTGNSDDLLHLETCDTTKEGSLASYRLASSVKNFEADPLARVFKATILLEEECVVAEPEEISPLTVDEKYQLILQLASESTFYQTGGRTFRIDSYSCEIEDGVFFVSDENTGYTQNVYVESVKDTDVFMKTFNVSVKDFLASHISETNA